jgi:hypothetical protein
MIGSLKSSTAWYRAAIASGFVLTLAALAGCASEPLSYLDGVRFNRVEINTFDTLIVSVDGKSYPFNYRIPVTAGRHHIVFQTRPADGFAFSPDRAMDIDIEPCTEYWFEAKKLNPLEQDYLPRVNYKIHIPGCGDVAANSRMGY